MTVKYSYQGDTIAFSQAKEFIAKTVSPEKDQTKERNKIGGRINTALKNGTLPRETLLEDGKFKIFDADKLFRWARLVDGWESLQEVEGIPYKPQTWNEDIEFGTKLALGCSAGEMPADVNNDHARAKERYWEDQNRIAELEARLKRVEQENAMWREKDKQKRDKGSESGKKGKGIPKNRLG